MGCHVQDRAERSANPSVEDVAGPDPGTGDPLAGPRCVPDAVVAGVDPDVVDASAALEEHQVAGAAVGLADVAGTVGLGTRRARQVPSDLAEHPTGVGRAVEGMRAGRAVPGGGAPLWT